MVVLLEPVCHSWMHEEGNAGFLETVKEICNEEIVYVGEREHLECISRIYRGGGVSYKQIMGFNTGNEWDDYKMTAYYFKMIQMVMREYRPSQLFILCAYRPCILAAELAAFVNKKCNVFVLLHGMVEELKNRSTSYRRLFRLSGYFRNIRFLTYSPYCTAEYWGVSEDKMTFISLPYVKPRERVRRNIDPDKTVIGVIGGCANNKALHVIKLVNKKGIKKRYEFWVVSRFGEMFRGVPHVKVLDLEFSREQKMKTMSHMDYLLLPYGKQEYAISASGVLWDAVANEVPCLMLDSRYFEYYIPYGIGCQANNIQELADMIEQRILQGKDEDVFFQGMDRLKQYNREVIKGLLGYGGVSKDEKSY